MKKAVIALLVILVIGLGAGIYWKVVLAKFPIERMLPQKPLVYTHLSNIGENWESLQQSKFWSKISDIDFGRFSGHTVGEEKELLRGDLEILDFFKELGIKQFFGQELALAIYPVEGNESLSDLIPDIILISRVEPEAKILVFISKVYEKLVGIEKFASHTEPYKNHEITTIKLKENKFDLFYSIIKDLLVIGNNKVKIKKSIDLFTNGKNSLVRDEGFRFVKAEMPRNTDLFSYFDFRSLLAFVKELEPLIWKQMASRDPYLIEKTKERFNRTLERFQMFKNGGFGFTFGDIPTIKGITMLDTTKILPHLVKLYEFEPERNRTLNFVPRDVIFYYWTNNVDLQSYWENLQYEISMARKGYDRDVLEVEKLIQDFESNTGIDIEGDIIPLTGNEFVFLLSDIDVGGIFPIPKIAFFIEIKDEPVTERFLDTYLKERPDTRFSSETYSGKTIEYMVLPFGANLQPCYSLVNGFLITSISRDLLKEIIDTLDERYPSLPQSYGFKAIDIGVTGKNNSVGFLNIETSLDRVKGIAEWAIAWQNMAISGMDQKLEQIGYSIDKLKLEFGVKKSQINDAKLKLRSLIEEESRKAVEQELADKEKELVQLEEEIGKKQKELDEHRKSLDAQREQFKAMETNFQQIVYPVMEALGVFKSVSSKMTTDKGRIETVTYLNIEKR